MQWEPPGWATRVMPWKQLVLFTACFWVRGWLAAAGERWGEPEGFATSRQFFPFLQMLVWVFLMWW